MIKHQILINKHLHVQTQRRTIFDLFKLINEDTIAMPLLLLFIPLAKWYSVHRSRNSKQSTASYRKISKEFSKNYKSTIFQKLLWMVALSWQVIFLLNQYYIKLKNQKGETMGQNTGKNDFLHDFNNFNKNCGWTGGLLSFIVELISRFLEHWNINNRQLYLYCPGIFLTWTR